MRGKSFDELYPGKYIRASEFKDKPVTLTVKSVDREMLSNGTGGEEGAVVMEFEETPKALVVNRTNGVAFRALYGDDSGDWIGKQITLHAVPDSSGLSESGKCIRVLGAPQLTKPLKFKAHVGRSMLTQTLQPTGKHEAPADIETIEEEELV
jgi:hypothetical protein